MTRDIVIFDFDGTLIEGDSLAPFFIYAHGWKNFLRASAESCIAFLASSAEARRDRRTFFKQQLINRLLKGHRPEEFSAAVQRLKQWVRWKEDIRAALESHHAKGRHIVVATGALDLYMRALLEGLPVDDLLCTELVLENGVITGAMKRGNCVRAGKAACVADFLQNHGPFGEIWAYGNQPHDLPLLALAKHKIIVS